MNKMSYPTSHNEEVAERVFQSVRQMYSTDPIAWWLRFGQYTSELDPQYLFRSVNRYFLMRHLEPFCEFPQEET